MLATKTAGRNDTVCRFYFIKIEKELSDFSAKIQALSVLSVCETTLALYAKKPHSSESRLLCRYTSFECGGTAL